MLSATGVSNQIAIKPDVSASAVKREIEEALKRRSTSEINVAVNGTEMTLTAKFRLGYNHMQQAMLPGHRQVLVM